MSRRRPLCCLLLLSQARPSGKYFRIINPVRHREQRASSCRRVLDIPWKGCAPICPHADRKSDGRWPFPGLTAPACPLRQLWQAGAAPPTAPSPSRGPTQSGPLLLPPPPTRRSAYARLRTLTRSNVGYRDPRALAGRISFPALRSRGPVPSPDHSWRRRMECAGSSPQLRTTPPDARVRVTKD